MSKVYCRSDFKKLEREFKIQRIKTREKAGGEGVVYKNPLTLLPYKPLQMNKIHKALLGLWQLIKNPWLLNHVLDDEQYWRKKVVKKYGVEQGLPLIGIDDLFPGLEEQVSPYAYLDGSCLPTDLALLRGLAKKYGASNYLEIGTWRGESVANVAPLVNKAVTLNLSEEEMLAMGMSKDYAGLHCLFSAGLSNVTHLRANSLNFDFASLEQEFDLIFIDGDHHYETVRSDSGSVLRVLKPEKGMIVWHDYARNPEQVRWSVLAGILDGLPPEMHHDLYHVSNTLCAVYLPGLDPNVPRKTLKANDKPTKFFSIALSIRSFSE